MCVVGKREALERRGEGGRTHCTEIRRFISVWGREVEPLQIENKPCKGVVNVYYEIMPIVMCYAIISSLFAR